MSHRGNGQRKMKEYWIKRAIELMPYMANWDFSDFSESEVHELIRMFESNK